MKNTFRILFSLLIVTSIISLQKEEVTIYDVLDYATGAGLYLLDIVDNWMNSFSIVVIGLLEAVIIGWVIGADKIREHTNAESI